MRDNEGIPVEDRPDCPLCGAPGSLRYGDLRDRFFGIAGVWSLRECPRCGHVWLDPAPPAAETGRLYTTYFPRSAPGPAAVSPSVFGDHATRGLYVAVGYDAATRDPRERLLGRLLYRVPWVRDSIEARVRYVHGPPRGRLLDVGSGTGDFLRLMRSLGWSVQGIEPFLDEGTAGDLDVLRAPLESAAVAAASADVVTMHHVIEHLTDPVAALRACARIARPGGLVVVRTPNWEGLGRRTFGSAWMHLDPPRHLHLFTPAGLRDAVVRAGLEVEAVRTAGLDAPLVSQVSRDIAATGHHDFSVVTPLDVAARAFGWRESAMRRLRADAGEEIVLHARRPGG